MQNFVPSNRAERTADYFASCGASTCKMCERSTTGKSKYCAEHKAEARRLWKGMVEGKAIERDERYEKFKTVYEEACRLGVEAGNAHTPTPMVVQAHSDMMDDSSPVEQEWHVPSGVCGFAWVTIRPGNCSFARWLTKNKHARKAYGGGVQIWISSFGQSMEKKEKCARAMSEHIRKELGVSAYAGSRMD